MTDGLFSGFSSVTCPHFLRGSRVGYSLVDFWLGYVISIGSTRWFRFGFLKRCMVWDSAQCLTWAFWFGLLLWNQWNHISSENWLPLACSQLGNCKHYYNCFYFHFYRRRILNIYSFYLQQQWCYFGWDFLIYTFFYLYKYVLLN